MPQEKIKSSRLDSQSLKHLLTAGGLVAGTLGTLLLGAALQVDPRTVAAESPSAITGRLPGTSGEPPSAGAAVVLPPKAGGTLTSPEPVAERTAPRAEPARVVGEAQRHAQGAQVALRDRNNDPRRMVNTGNEWTLQFMVTCSSESATHLLENVAADERLYLLPISLNDQSCFRICWDTFRSRDRALASRDIPAALSEINAEPIARKVADVIS